MHISLCATEISDAFKYSFEKQTTKQGYQLLGVVLPWSSRSWSLGGDPRGHSTLWQEQKSVS